MSASRKQTETTDRQALAERVLDEYAKIAFCRRKKHRGVPLTAADQLAALHALGKHLGLFIDKHEVDIGERLSAVFGAVTARVSPAVQKRGTASSSG